MIDSSPTHPLVRSLLAALLGALACDEGPGEVSRSQTDLGAGGSANAAGAGGRDAGSGGGAGAARDLDAACLEGAPQLIDGVPSGMRVCADGTLARIGPTTCRLADLTKDPVCPLGGPSLAGDTSVCETVCDAGPHGRPRAAQWQPACRYFCETQADCPGGTTCACDEEGFGQCVQGACALPGDCGAGSSCRLTSREETCVSLDFRGLECIGAEDLCIGDRDCSDGARRCLDNDHDGAKACAAQGPICGRPLGVGGKPIVAALMRRAAWA